MRVPAGALLLAGLACADEPVARHEVTSLPGYQKFLPSKMFTGFINAGTPPSGKGSMYFHYTMMQSEGNPAVDPVIVWYNGGPGASSLFGLLQEFGPLLLNVDSYDADYKKTGIPSPQRNLLAWTRYATIVAIDSPPPIGFSFCTEFGPSGNGTSCGPWTDKSVFKANHAAHRTLFTKIFPEFLKNPVYLMGESYAGIYVPGFVNEMLDDPIEGLNFRGFLVGDGWTGCPPKAGHPMNWCTNLNNVGFFKYPNVNVGPWYDIEFMHGHSQFSESLYRQIRASCTEAELRSYPLSDVCQGLVDQMAKEIGGWYVYDLFNDCAGQPFRGKYGLFGSLHHRRAVMTRIALGRGHAGGGAPCPVDAMEKWVARKEVRDALGVQNNTNFLNCDNAQCFNYTEDQPQVTTIYSKALKAGLRVLIYEGDSDASGLETAPVEDVFVPYFKQEGYNQTRSWRPWTTDGAQRMGGYVIEWENRKVQFVSIRGAGHLVPLNKPETSATMLQKFLYEEALPEFVAP
eukprot:TRINITY_DN6110_c0_g1_i1.p2 TRINITY_DN6110_c0_g1~~TRINITY_DN6110_c0_g1_i1.p2  ORF type:complete len:514 (+),score=175.51 TRINITY_DN6110_c0_g1_i1:61-1602(+)